MRNISPDGPVYQAGTLSGNPLAMTAGIETLKILSKPDTYKKLMAKSALLEESLKDAAKRAGVKTKFYRAGTMFCTYFTDKEVYNFDDAAKTDMDMFGRFFREMIERGVNLAPSGYESGFMSLAHTTADIRKTARAAYESFKKAK
jgi:glutamate-1-semialdehyde 2,1-aminomutase